MDNRTNILKCALDLFSRKGYESIGVQEIALASEITKPTMYYYFGSKLGLLEVLLKENFSLLFDKLNSSAEYKGDLPLTLFRVTKDYFSFASQNKQFYRMQLSLFFSPEESETIKAISPMYNKQIKILDEMFLKASNDHGNMKGRHSLYAATFMGMINTYINMFLTGHIELDDECIYKAVHQFMHGIYS